MDLPDPPLRVVLCLSPKFATASRAVFIPAINRRSHPTTRTREVNTSVRSRADADANKVPFAPHHYELESFIPDCSLAHLLPFCCHLS